MRQTLDLFVMGWRWTSPPQWTGPILYTQHRAAVRTRAPHPSTVSTDVLAYERQPQKYNLYFTLLYFLLSPDPFFLSLLSMSPCNGTLYSRFSIISFLKVFLKAVPSVATFSFSFILFIHSFACVHLFFYSPCLSPIPSTLSKRVIFSFHVDQEHKNMFFSSRWPCGWNTAALQEFFFREDEIIIFLINAVFNMTELNLTGKRNPNLSKSLSGKSAIFEVYDRGNCCWWCYYCCHFEDLKLSNLYRGGCRDTHFTIRHRGMTVKVKWDGLHVRCSTCNVTRECLCIVPLY